MASTPVITLRKGHAVRHNNEVCIVIDHELKTPPRMASYVQMSIRSVATKKVFNLRMTSNDSLDSVLLERIPHEYSYKDSSGYHFLNPETYEDTVVYEDLVDPVKNYLIDGQVYTILLADSNVASIDLPASMVEWRFGSNQRQHAAHPGRQVQLLNVQSRIGRALSVMTVRTQIPRA